MIPILILQGSKDLQVTVQDAENLSKASTNSELLIIDKMNHILKVIEGDQQTNLESYNNENLPISEKLISKIVSFIQK
jgi:fermentation-respiration switch protein FrsA (DUF1100 family)